MVGINSARFPPMAGKVLASDVCGDFAGRAGGRLYICAVGKATWRSYRGLGRLLRAWEIAVCP